MNEIHDATSSFKFENISMTSPASISGGAYFSKFLINREPLYIQTPKCSTKMGIVKSGKKMHMDLVFSNIDEEFIQWIETLETTTRKMIYSNREKWFDMELSEDDIESYFTPTVKLFKSGKQYLVRVNINQLVNGSPAAKIYDESEVDVAPDTLNDKNTIITIIEVQGVRCSAKSFQIDLILKQIMVIKPVEIFDKCIIKTRSGGKDAIQSSLAPNIQMTIVSKNDEIEDKVEDTKQLTIDEPFEDKDDKHFTLSESYEDEDITIFPEEIKTANQNDLLEVDLDGVNFKEEDTIVLKDKSEVYYEMYRNARKKAKLAKSLALSSFMEARRIKNMYMLDDLEDSDDEIDLENMDKEGSDEDE
jgi:hypothetical protein